jgi:hypothetical protein
MAIEKLIVIFHISRTQSHGKTTDGVDWRF